MPRCSHCGRAHTARPVNFFDAMETVVEGEPVDLLAMRVFHAGDDDAVAYALVDSHAESEAFGEAYDRLIWGASVHVGRVQGCEVRELRHGDIGSRGLWYLTSSHGIDGPWNNLAMVRWSAERRIEQGAI